jgi:hypothetical protein
MTQIILQLVKLKQKLSDEYSIEGEIVTTRELPCAILAIVAQRPALLDAHFGPVYHLVELTEAGNLSVNWEDDQPEDLAELRKFINFV